MNFPNVFSNYRSIRAYAHVLLALLMILLMIIPAQIWRQPAIDAVYPGFDSNLLFVNSSGYGISKGIVDVTPDTLRITTLPSSQPVVHLVTSPLSFSASMDIVIRQNANNTLPLRLGIWSPRGGSGFFLNFGPPPSNLVSAQTLILGAVGMILIGGTPVQDEILGQYFLNQPYHLEMSVNKTAGVIRALISTIEGPPTGTPMLRLMGGPSRVGYSDILSAMVPVQGGRSYAFGGLVNATPESLAYKIDIQWFDRNGTNLGSAGDWSDARQLQGWTRRILNFTAPSNAASARLLLGSGDNSTAFFANLFVEDSNLGTNLLSNGDFKAGTNGWLLTSQHVPFVQLLNPFRVSWQASINADRAPELLSSLRLSLTASSSSSGGTADVVLQNYSLTLPHQTWEVIQVNDLRATGFLVAFLLAGLILAVVQSNNWFLRRFRSLKSGALRKRYRDRLNIFSILRRRNFVEWTVLTAIFLFVNAYLVTLGSHPFDMDSQEVWAYIAVHYNPLGLYQQPNTVPVAAVWGGAPYHEAVFPYQPLMAYIFLAIGQLYRLIVPSGELAVGSRALEILIKSFNILFVLADSVAIYLILRKLTQSHNQSLLGAGFFLLNPAVLFSASIWGQTHVISLFPLLVSIWLFEKKWPFWAWLTLALACLTRPQMLVPALLLAVIFLRKFRFKENVHAISWSVILIFLLISPFLVSTAPSLPKDLLANTLYVQEAGGNEVVFNIVSLDAYSIWPLITYIIAGQRGLSRIFYSSTSPLLGTLSYQQVSQILTISVILVVTGLLLFNRRARSAPEKYFLLLALGTIGFLFFSTGLAATHYVIGLPFLILCKRSLTKGAHYPIIGLWSLTTFVPMYGDLGFVISNVGYLVPALYQSAATGFFMTLFSSDLFMTIGTAVNGMIFAWLAAETWLRLRSREETPQLSP